MKKHMTYFPELNISLGLFAPMVVYNPIKPKTIVDDISPSASYILIIGIQDWDAPEKYA